MKNFLPRFFACLTCIFCGLNSYAAYTIIVTNTSDVALKNKPVSISRNDLPKYPAGNYYPVIIGPAGDTIASQLDDINGDNAWDQLFFVANLPAGKQVIFKLSWSKKEPAYTKRTSIRFGVRKSFNSRVEPATADTFYPNQLPAVMGYQRYQTDGPTWENDKVGFRQYLDGRNSIDVFGKKTAGITPENVGINKAGVTEPDYSNMQDWGTDILHVGNSAGLGAFSLLIDDSLARLGVTEKDPLNNVDSTIFHIVTEGPVHSIMQFNYRGWRPLNRNYNVQQTTSIWPGIYAFENEISFDKLSGDETVVVGLVNSRTEQKLTEIMLNDKWVVLLTHDKQTVNKEWWLGMALILPKENYAGYLEAPKTGSISTTYLGKLKLQNNKPLTYFAVAGWELSDAGFSDAAYFKNYVTNLVHQLTATVAVKIY